MALDDVVNGFERANLSRSIVETIKKDPFNPQAFNNFLAYTQKYEKIDGVGIQAMAEELKKDPRQFRTLLETKANDDQKALIEASKNNYSLAVSALSDDYLKSAALQIPNKDIKYMDIARKLQAGDFESAKKAYAELYDSKLWKDFVEGASKGFIQKFMTTYIVYNQDAFLKKKLSKTTQKDGKPEYKFDAQMARNYILEGTSKVKDEAEKNNIYGMISSQAYASKKGIKLEKKPTQSPLNLEDEGDELDLAA
ncbi:MAG: hypothetical protein AABX17_00780 [Nanoarchaeota archaeon]